MKTARILLAVISLAALAACGNDSITAPGSMAPGGARHETAPAPGDDATIDDSIGGGVTSEGPPSVCDGTVVTTTDSSGNVTTTCVTAAEKGGTYGSGG
jgi:hypothetical protein